MAAIAEETRRTISNQDSESLADSDDEKSSQSTKWAKEIVISDQR